MWMWTQAFQSGYNRVEIGGGRYAQVPTGVYHEIVRLALYNENHEIIPAYLLHRYGLHLRDSTIDGVIARYDSELMQAFRNNELQPEPGVRPRHTGHRITSLPQTPVRLAKVGQGLHSSVHHRHCTRQLEL